MKWFRSTWTWLTCKPCEMCKTMISRNFVGLEVQLCQPCDEQQDREYRREMAAIHHRRLVNNQLALLRAADEARIIHASGKAAYRERSSE